MPRTLGQLTPGARKSLAELRKGADSDHLAQSSEEFEAWQKVRNESNLKKKSAKARRYLEEFPLGGYVPYAHRVLAVYCRSDGKLADFISHAEKALEGLPQETMLLSSLSKVYADQEMADKAIDLGLRALKILPWQEVPPEAAVRDWERERRLSMIDAHYGVGAGYLRKVFEPRARAKNLNLAFEHLSNAIELNPKLDRAHFLLGYAYQIKGDSQKAISEYAFAVACGGPNEKAARSRLETLYGNEKGVEELIERHRRSLEEDVTQTESVK
jgi:tetratricopeptide (TPR) repeat protein